MVEPSHKFGNIRRVQKKTELFFVKTLFYILSTVPFKAVPSTGDTLFPTFLPLLECFLEHPYSMLYLKLFNRNNSYLIAPQCEVILTLPVLCEFYVAIYLYIL
jgi:hypothetical protein